MNNVKKNVKKTIHYAIPVALAAAGASDPAHADQIFLNFNGEIPGESVDESHKNEIDVLSWSWNMSRDPGSGGGGPTPAQIRDIKVIKYVDKATPQLALRLLDGKGLSEANLIVRNTGGKGALEYLKIKMSDVVVTKVAQGGDQVAARASETVALSFSQVCITYTPLVGGLPGAPSTTCWDIQSNSKL